MLAITFAALASWSWRKWPDPFIDFGSQLYIPWQLAEGKALYYELEYKDGPLSQHLNEYGFGYFGVDRRHGRQIMNWVRRAYRRVALIGHEPLTDGRFGILLLERIDPNRPSTRPSWREPERRSRSDDPSA